jgi:hypothetical protein
MQVTPGSSANVVGCANDLKPLRVRLFRYTRTVPVFCSLLGFRVG